MATKKKSKPRIAIIDTPDGQRRVTFRTARELALRLPPTATRAIVGREVTRKVVRPSPSEYMVVTDMPSPERRKAGEGVSVEGFYRDYDGQTRKIEGTFSTQLIGASIRGGRGMQGLGKSRRSKSLSRSRALEIFGGAPSKAGIPTMYGAPSYKRESVKKLAPKRAGAAGALSMRQNPEYLSDSMDLPMSRVNPAHSMGASRGRRGGGRGRKGGFPFRKF
jgi:hypothetical protein